MLEPTNTQNPSNIPNNNNNKLNENNASGILRKILGVGEGIKSTIETITERKKFKEKVENIKNLLKHKSKGKDNEYPSYKCVLLKLREDPSLLEFLKSDTKLIDVIKEGIGQEIAKTINAEYLSDIKELFEELSLSKDEIRNIMTSENAVNGLKINLENQISMPCLFWMLNYLEVNKVINFMNDMSISKSTQLEVLQDTFKNVPEFVRKEPSWTALVLQENGLEERKIIDFIINDCIEKPNLEDKKFLITAFRGLNFKSSEFYSFVKTTISELIDNDIETKHAKNLTKYIELIQSFNGKIDSIFKDEGIYDKFILGIEKQYQNKDLSNADIALVKNELIKQYDKKAREDIKNIEDKYGRTIGIKDNLIKVIESLSRFFKTKTQ